jgi:16S rRNA (uracil1498-N3)-methyltransferase
MRQFIVENKQIHDGLIQLEGKDYRYLRQVLRVRAGDMISVRLPDGSLNNATVARIDEGARRITLQLCAGTGETITRGVQAEELTGAAGADGNSASGMGGVEYWLFQFLPRPQKFELIVRQATECGVSGIVPVVGEYTEKSSVQSLMGAKRERLERIVREARQQSGSPVDTKVLEPMNLEKAIELWQTESTVVEPAVPEPGRRVETTVS